MRDAWGPSSDERGQSETIGFVLLIAIAAIGITGVVVLGSAAVDDSRHAMETGSAEHAMTEFDSRISLVAHGDSSSQVATLPDGRSQSVRAAPDAGNLTLSIHNETDGTTDTLLTTSLGAVTYENGDTTIAYQGGGVWRQSGTGVSSMVSPPEVHYQGTTLTLPLVLVNGDGAVTGQAQVTQNGTANAVFPTADRSNPLDRGVVTLEVESAYYEAWGRYFEQRMSGEAVVDHSTSTARINLTVPFEGAFDTVVATTDSADSVTVNGGGNGNGNGGGGGAGTSFNYTPGVNYPSADSRIESMIDDCQNGSCTNDTDTITSNGTYYWDSDPAGSISVDDPGGNVSLVVNGPLTIDELSVSGLAGNESVTAYVRGDYTINGDVNGDGSSDELKTLVHSDGQVEMKGGTTYVGLLYAPGSSCEFKGSGSFEGAVVCESLTVNGNPSNTFEYGGDAIRTTDLGLDADASRVTFLHVSTTTVNVTAA